MFCYVCGNYILGSETHKSEKFKEMFTSFFGAESPSNHAAIKF